MSELSTYYNIPIEHDLISFNEMNKYRKKLITFVSDKEADNPEAFFRRNYPLGRHKYPLAHFLYKKIARLIKEYEAEDSDILPVDLKLSGNFMLPIGHPLKGVVYVSHPAEPKIYYPFSDFHNYLFEHKFSELWSILLSLGATKISIEVIKGRKVNLDSCLKIPHLNIDIHTTSDQVFHAKLSGTYENKTSEPKLPANLVWFEFEETWKQIAYGRINNHVRNFSLNLLYKDDFGINGSLKSTIEGLNLSLGGTYESFETTEWRITGEF